MKRLFSICLACLLSVALYAQQSYKLTLTSDPEGTLSRIPFYLDDKWVAEDNQEVFDVPAGAVVRISPAWNYFRVYSSSNWYKFREFSFGAQSVELLPYRTYTDQWYFVMPEHDVDICYNYDYNPNNPGYPNPNPNGWDPETGTLIVDDVVSVSEWTAFLNTVPSEDYPLVERIIVSGSFFHSELTYYFHDYPNLSYVDLSRTTLETVTNSEGYSWRSYFNNLPNVTDLLLPSTVKSFTRNIFSGTPMQNLTLFAVTPPTLPFDNYYDSDGDGQTERHDDQRQVAFNNPDMVVFVPAEAVPLYQAAEGWKDFTILPISGDAVDLTLNLMDDPTAEKVAIYRNMTIEMTNTHTQQTRHMLVSGRNTYTFRSLPINTSYNIRLLSAHGATVGELNNVFVGEENVEQTFPQLLVPHDLQLYTYADTYYRGIGKYGTELTEAKAHLNCSDNVDVTWLGGDNQTLAQGNFITGVVAGQSLKYVVKIKKDDLVTLDHDCHLREMYVVCDTVSYTVSEDLNARHSLRLQPLHKISIYAYDPLVDYSYSPKFFEGSATRLVDGETIASYGITPNEPGYSGWYLELPEGNYTASVKGLVYDNMPGRGTEDYATLTQTFDLDRDTELRFEMRKPSGNVIMVTAMKGYGVVPLETPDAAHPETILDLRQATVRISDLTNGRENLTYSLQGGFGSGSIVLSDTLAAGTRLQVYIDPNRNSYPAKTFDLTVEHPDSIIRMQAGFYSYGVIAPSAEGSTGNVRAFLMDSEGLFYHYQPDGYPAPVISFSGNNGTLTPNTTVSGIEEGSYTLIFVNGNSSIDLTRFNTMDDVNRLLTSGKNCLMVPVEVKNGFKTKVEVGEIPPLGELTFFLSDQTSRVTYNQDNIALGFMQTVKVNVGFRPEYRNRVSDLRLSFRLIGNERFVPGSVMVGRELQADYRPDIGSTADHQPNYLNVPNIDDQVRFCTMPLNEGTTGWAVQAVFKIDGVEYSEYLPSSTYQVKAATISTPSITSDTQFMVRGTTLPKAEVTVMQGDEAIGYTVSNEAGSWGVLCTLDDPINLNTYDIYAVIKVQGSEIKTNTVKVKYDQDEITPLTVKMTWFNNHPVHMFQDEFTWDYVNGLTKNYYDFSNLAGIPTDVSFIVNLSENDSTIVKAVTLTVFTSDHESRDLQCSYDGKQDRWVATDAFFTSNLPVNIHTEVVASRPRKVDAVAFVNTVNSHRNSYNDYVEQIITSENAMYYYYRDANGKPLVDKDSTEPVSLPVPSGYTIDTDALINGGLAEFLRQMGAEDCAAILSSTEPLAGNPYGPGDREKWLADLEDLLVQLDDYADKWGLPDYRQYDTDFSVINQLSEDLDNGAMKYSAPYTTSHSRLIADGFVSMVSTDGSIIYRRQTSDYHVTFVIPKENLQIELNWTDNGSRLSQAVNELLAGAPRKDAFDSLLGLINNLKEMLDEVLTWAGRFTDGVQNIARVAKVGKKTGDAIVKSTTTCVKYGMDHGWLNSASGAGTLGKTLTRQARALKAKQSCQWIQDKCTWIMGSKLGRFAQKLGNAFSVYGLMNDISGCITELYDVINCYSVVPDPCDDDKQSAEGLRNFIAQAGLTVGSNYLRKITCDIADMKAETAAVAGSVASSGGSLLLGALFKVGIFAGKWAMDYFFDDTWKEARPQAMTWFDQLECVKSCKKKGTCPKPDKPGGGDDDGGDGKGKPDFPGTKPNLDPSGFVYEAVESNRVEGATATVYYKDIYKDMYGDEHERDVQWDAENYDQVNPQTTDQNGEYGWMVPEGLWQVKFEKQGYETTYSDWLPVPPPQLDVNVGMRQVVQPQVESVKAYEKGVQVNFDKFMQPATLTTDNIFLTRNGQKISGTIELVKAQEGDLAQTYAPAVRFVPAQQLTTGQKVMLTVRSAVKSYAGIEMEQDFQQEFDVEKRVEQIVADSVVNVVYGQTRTIKVATVPADAAVGKKMRVESLSNDIAAPDRNLLTIDSNGEAQLTVSGELLGSTVIRFTMDDDEDATAVTVIGVRDALGIYALAPVASHQSGSQVYYGTKIRLTSETHGAQIYYTLDGTCPCESNNPAVRLYDDEQGIVIESDEVTVNAMAIAPDLEQSYVETYTYYLRKNTAAVSLKQGWNWVSHNQRNGVAAAQVATGSSYVVNSSGQRVSTMQPEEGYKVYAAEAKDAVLTGQAWNPTEQELTVTTGWNWIAYPMNQVMTPDEAFAYASAAAGDLIVGQEGFAEYDGTGWKGSLKTLRPGEGYLYKASQGTSLLLNSSITSSAASLTAPQQVQMWGWDKYAKADVMPVTAQLRQYGSPVSDDDFVVAAFSGNDCRAEGVWNGGLLYINVVGEQGETISFKVYNKQTLTYYDVNESLTFAADNRGSLNAPTALNVGSVIDGINEVLSTGPGHTAAGAVYDLQGRKVSAQQPSSAANGLKKGIYISNHQKVIIGR